MISHSDLWCCLMLGFPVISSCRTTILQTKTDSAAVYFSHWSFSQISNVANCVSSQSLMPHLGFCSCRVFPVSSSYLTTSHRITGHSCMYQIRRVNPRLFRTMFICSFQQNKALSSTRQCKTAPDTKTVGFAWSSLKKKKKLNCQRVGLICPSTKEDTVGLT